MVKVFMVVALELVFMGVFLLVILWIGLVLGFVLVFGGEVVIKVGFRAGGCFGDFGFFDCLV